MYGKTFYEGYFAPHVINIRIPLTDIPHPTHPFTSRRRPTTLLLLPPRQLALQRSEPLRQRILVTGAETVALLLGDDLHAMGLAAGDGVDLDGVDDV